MLPDCQWHTRQKGEEPLSWFPVPYMVSRHTWSMCSYQRVSTFASGSSSVSRYATPGGSRFRFVSTWPAGKNRRELPSLIRRLQEGKK